MATTFLTDVGMIMLFATVAEAVATRLRQPPVLGLLFIGGLVGPQQLGLVQSTEIVGSFVEIGAVMLLFAIGLEFNVSKLRRLGMPVVLMTLLKMGLILSLTYIAITAFGIGSSNAFVIGAILAISSTAITFKLLSQLGLIKRQEVPTLFGVLVIEDIIAVLLLAIFSGISKGGASPSLIFTALQALLVFGIFYIIVSPLIRAAVSWLSKYRAEETLALISIALGVGFSYLAQLFGLSSSIGAFLAGSLVATFHNSKDLERAIKPFVSVFSSIFFFSMGTMLNFNSIISDFPFLLMISAGVVLVKFFGMSASAYLFGFSSKSAAFAGLAMLPIGEFSLLFAGQFASSFPKLIELTAFLVFVSSILTTLLLGRLDLIYSSIYLLIPDWLKNRARIISDQNRLTMRRFSRSKKLTLYLSNFMTFVGRNLVIVALVIGMTYFSAGIAATFISDFSGNYVGMLSMIAFAITFAAAVWFVYSTYDILKSSAGELGSTQNGMFFWERVSSWARSLFIFLLLLLLPLLFALTNPESKIADFVILTILLALFFKYAEKGSAPKK